MKTFKAILLIIFLLTVIFGGKEILNNLQKPSYSRAVGDIIITSPIPPGSKLFDIQNWKPGDSVSKTLSVKNEGIITRLISIKAEDISDIPALSKMITLEIKTGNNILYASKPLKDFYNTSSVILTPLAPEESVDYIFTAKLLEETGNKYQGVSTVFDLIVGYETGDHLVINEIYYWPDKNHGAEWIELYNPTDKPINLKNWIIENSKTKNIINSNKIILPNSFAILVKNASFKKYWPDLPKNTLIIELGKIISDGLGDTQDNLILRYNSSVVDSFSWSEGFSNVSYERLVPGIDTDQPADFYQNPNPSPGF